MSPNFRFVGSHQLFCSISNPMLKIRAEGSAIAMENHHPEIHS